MDLRNRVRICASGGRWYTATNTGSMQWHAAEAAALEAAYEWAMAHQPAEIVLVSRGAETRLATFPRTARTVDRAV